MLFAEKCDAKSEEEKLLEELIDMYGEELKRIAYLYLRDQSQCEDVVQEAFISCYKNLSKFRNEASYKTWLIRITINKCKDYQKKWSFRNILYKPIIQSQVSSTEDMTQKEFEKKEETSLVIECIYNLPRKYKDVLILYYYQEMKMEEIGKVLCIKHNTVKSRILRGKSVLKAELERRNYCFG